MDFELWLFAVKRLAQTYEMAPEIYAAPSGRIQENEWLTGDAVFSFVIMQNLPQPGRFFQSLLSSISVTSEAKSPSVFYNHEQFLKNDAHVYSVPGFSKHLR